ncbi:MAG TPA: hypothetical protein VE800_00580, partial [Actinomycetota bacterium]|nr:hypothetical protein [Actinomycetota bacterium]
QEDQTEVHSYAIADTCPALRDSDLVRVGQPGRHRGAGASRRDRQLALFVSMQAVALAALVLGSTILYLRKVGEGSFKEGLLVGLGWVVVMIALDLAHSVLMPGMVPDIAAHLAVVVPTYVVVPIITAPTMGYLERRSRQPGS